MLLHQPSYDARHRAQSSHGYRDAPSLAKVGQSGATQDRGLRNLLLDTQSQPLFGVADVPLLAVCDL